MVATRIPQSGVSWVNKHGVSGLNVMPGNAGELACAIQDIADNESVYDKYSMAAKNRYWDIFTNEHMIDKCKRIYNNLWEG